ncbi:MAG: type II restriction endonuclease [Gammaproteobacteria bacterium]
MARIEDSKIKKASGGYQRLFGIPALGLLMSRVHSAVISSGNELEKIIIDRIKKVENLDEFLNHETMPDGVLVATKQQIKACNSLDFPRSEPDFIIFKRREGRQNCHVIELKDGHQFDTKKAVAERDAIYSFIEQTARHLHYTVSAHFCCFNQDSKEAIVDGFKRKITRAEAMTGREFCDLLEINYDEIIRQRMQEQPRNFRYFLSEVVKIDQARVVLRELLKKPR